MNVPPVLPALHAFLDGIIDFAGLFPPAKLDMATTVRAYAAHRASPDAWMLGRLVVPTARLAEFEREAEALLPGPDDEDLWEITALVADADEAGNAALDADLDAIFAFNERHAERGSATVDSIEFKAASSVAIERALELVPEGLHPYVELALPPAGGEIRGLVAALSGADASAKVRTGGLVPEAFPSPAALANFIECCAAASVPLKATAGLHHPLRHHDASIGSGVTMHGFLNVFGAAVAAWALRLDRAAIERILTEESAQAFRFTDDSATICGHALPIERLAVARERFARSFGSCSFDEPIADLRSIGLLVSDAADRADSEPDGVAHHRPVGSDRRGNAQHT